jgi:transposase
MQVVLNKKEKEQLVIKLYQDGNPIREIARQAHLSFGSIGKIIRAINSGDDDNCSSKSKSTKALYLFKSGKKPIEVAIELDISASEVEELQQEFWALISYMNSDSCLMRSNTICHHLSNYSIY